MKYLIVGVVLAIGSVSFMSFKPNTAANINRTDHSIEAQENPYTDLRKRALEITLGQLGIKNTKETRIFGIVMDWDLGEGVATVVAYETGDASLYLSNGGGIIGGGGEEAVRQAVAQYLKVAQGFLSKTQKAETTPLPDKNSVRFYLLTNQGVRYYQENMRNFENGSSEWLSLFKEVNTVMTNLRSMTNGKY